MAAPYADGTGNYAAIPTNSTGSWQVGQGSGEFSYSVPIAMPAPASGTGPTPSLSLDYSSGSVDGMTNASNGQSSLAGIGWSMDPGYITRNYVQCSTDGMTGKGDLCWKTSNSQVVQDLTIHLGSRTSRLVQIGTTSSYRLVDDPGWLVTDVTTTSPGPSTPQNSAYHNEAFKVQTPDGTTYWFGWGHGLNSTSVVPVYGNNSGEPCYSATITSAWCNQAWMWHLDLVTDIHGNYTEYSYTQENNYYARYATTSNHQLYNRASYLTDIQYGYGRGSLVAHSNVAITSVGRCVQEVASPPTACSSDPRTDPTNWPDVPASQICNATDTCTNGSPTFFSTMRYDSILTSRVNGSTTTNVDNYQLMFGFPSPDPGNQNATVDLWLSQINRTSYGDSGTNITVSPDYYFGGTFFQNRVAPQAGQASYRKMRITDLRNPHGGRIYMTYGHAPGNTCDSTYITGLTHYGSTEECFAEQLNGTWDWWHKYVVLELQVGDDALGYSPTTPSTATNLGQLQTYTYEYQGAPAWRDDSLPADWANSNETWDDWRGYQTTVVHRQVTIQGALHDASQEKFTVFRGMDGTPLNYTAGQKHATSFSDSLGTYTDSEWLGGRVAEDLLSDGSGNFVNDTAYEYGNYQTAPVTSSTGYAAEATYTSKKVYKTGLAGPADTTTYTVFDGGTSHTGINLGAPMNTIDDRGTPSDTTDDLATCNTYGSDSAKWLLVLMTTYTRNANCTTGTVLGYHENWYDNATATNVLPSSPTGEPLGDVTNSVDYTDATGVTNSVQTSYQYDSPYGRQTAVSTPHSSTATPVYTTTQFNPGGSADAMVTSVKVTGPTGLVTTTTLDAYHGAPISVVDPNLHTTTITRDGLGRPLTIDEPGRAAGDPDSISYIYLDDTAAPARVQTQVLRNATEPNLGPQVDTSWSFYDGWGRLIQTQRRDPTGNNLLVNSTGYDERGLPGFTLANVLVGGNTPSYEADLFDPTYVAHHTTTTYDAALRPVEQDDDILATQNSITTTTYNPTYTLVSTKAGTVGATPIATTKTLLDAAGRPSQVTQYANGTSPDTTGTLDDGSASYTYDPEGRLSTISNASTGTHPYTFSYDEIGRKMTATDPDVGTTSYTYDPLGDTTSVDDAMSNTTVGTINTAYDALGRPLTRVNKTYDSNNNVIGSTGLASWTYDDPSVPNGLGHLATVTSHTSMGDFVNKVTSYDAAGNALTEQDTYPGAITGESAGPITLTTTATYNLLGEVESTNYPAVGNAGSNPALAALTVNNNYGINGDLTSTGSSDGRTLANLTYDPVDRVQSIVSSSSATIDQDPNRFERDYTYTNLDQILTTSAVTGPLTPTRQQTTQLSLGYSYDVLGNPIQITGQQANSSGGTDSAAWCYTYDGISRMTSATTGVANGTACSAAGNPNTITPVTGANYSLTYNFTNSGISKVTDNNTGAYDTIQTASGHPHAPGTTQLQTGSGNPTGLPTAGTFTYDADGRATTWASTPAGTNTSYTYDPQDNLTDTNTTGTGASDIASAYDASGIRVARTTTQGTQNTASVYLGNVEIDKATDGTISATRTFSTPNGIPLATQTGTSGSSIITWNWLLADSQNSPRVSEDAAAGTIQHYAYYPYGSLATTTNPPASRGYLDKTSDPNGAIRLDHRSYTPNADAFTSPDPLMNVADPQTLNPYAYSRNNAIASEDPSGLMCDTCPSGYISINQTPDPGHPNEPATGPFADPGGDGTGFQNEHGENPINRGNPGYVSPVTLVSNTLYRVAHPVQTIGAVIQSIAADLSGCADHELSACGALWLNLFLVGMTTPEEVVGKSLVLDGSADVASAAAKTADDFVGPLSKAEFDGLQKSLEPNKLNHLFAKQQHGLDGLVGRYGSQEAVVEQMYRGLEGLTPSEGLFSVTRTIGGQAVTIDGRVVNGIPRIGTAYIKP
jgi:RHS repeat-associated protein